MTAAIIVLSVALVICVVCLLVLIYHQLLLINEVNKRLIILTEDSIENERNTMDMLNAKMEEQDAILRDKFETNNNPGEQEESDELEGFDPHEALDSLD